MSATSARKTPASRPVLVLALGLALSGACGRADKAYDPGQAISVQSGQIVVDPASPFLKHLEAGPVAAAGAQGDSFKVVGQIIALANSSDALSGSTVQWAELDPDLSRELGLHLDNAGSVPVGKAYGLVELPVEYRRQVARGDSVAISRYGLRKYETLGRVASVLPAPDGEAWMRVLLDIPAGGEWYPGNNCEVAFPLLRSRPVSVPTTALLHEGSQEFLLEETAAGHFKPLGIVILDTLGQSALVSGPVVPGMRIVSRGAILLKPFLHAILRSRAVVAAKAEGGK